MSAEVYSCPACGFPGLDEAPWQGAAPSDDICPCCGIHFGYDDFAGDRADLRPAFYSGWRGKWHTDGMQWWSSEPPPVGWDAEGQYRSVAEKTPRETTIYVKLLDEGTDVWRPARAAELGNGRFRLTMDPDYGRRNERWEFPPDSTVECEPRTMSGSVVLVATRLVSE